MTNEELLEKINQRFDSIEKGLTTVKATQQEQGKTLQTVQKDLTTLKRYARRTNKTLDLVARLYNQEDIKLIKRVDRLERQAGLPPME